MNYPYNVGLVTFCRCGTVNYEIGKEENADVLRLHNIPAVGFFNVHSTTVTWKWIVENFNMEIVIDVA